MSCSCQSINTFKSFLVRHCLKQSLHRRFPFIICLFTSVTSYGYKSQTKRQVQISRLDQNIRKGSGVDPFID